MVQVKYEKITHPKRIEQRGGDKERTNKRVYPDGVFGATLRNIKGSAQKARLVMDLIGPKHRKNSFLTYQEARGIIAACSKRFAYYADRLLKSAAAAAEDKDGTINPDDLLVIRAYADKGRCLRRWRPAAMGRTKPRIKHYCHLGLVLATPEWVEENLGSSFEGQTGLKDVIDADTVDAIDAIDSDPAGATAAAEQKDDSRNADNADDKE